MICVIAYITTRPGKRAEMLQAFNANLPSVRAEPGCIEYGPMVDTDTGMSAQEACGPDTFVVLEKWESPEALAAHANGPRTGAYASKAKELIAGWKAHMLVAG